MVRHTNQATNPDSLTPSTSATAERCPSEPILPNAVKANASMGEIVNALRDVFGTYVERPVF